MFKLFIYIVLFGFIGTVEAQHYSNTVEFAFSDEESYESRNDIAVFGDKVITYFDGEAGSGFYAYDVSTKSSEKLVSIDRRILLSTGRKFYKVPDGVLIDALGRLYLSDGTTSGTVLLKDFGENNVGGSLTLPRSRIINVERAGNSLYVAQQFQRANNGGFTNNQIWRIELSTAEVTLLSGVNSQSLKLVGGSASESGVIAFAYDSQHGYSFWRADKANDQLAFITRFNQNNDRALYIHDDGIQTRVGLIFCRVESNTTSLWRLSKNGKLTRLAEGCIQLFKADSDSDIEFYFTNLHGLWASSGSTYSDVLLLPTNTDTSVVFACVFDTTVLLSEGAGYPDSSSKVTLIETRTGSKQIFANTSLNSCLNEHALLVSKGRLSIYSNQSNTISKVFGKPALPIRGIREPVALGDNLYFEGGDKKLYKLELKTGNYVGYLPAILGLFRDPI